MLRVLEADQPWTLRNDIMLLADGERDGAQRWSAISSGNDLGIVT